ncbi:MAG: sulfurtransferase TusA family protein [Chloroflexi bacterium]|nr:sulfurtransferase TusA family protein [Chloroflexota bacterium]
MKADATLDCVGLYCPMPIHNTASKLKELKAGQVLEVLASDEAIRADAPAWCKATGNELLGIEEAAGEYKVYIKKTK